MSANQKKNAGLVPKLRFPEFREAGEWKQENLGSLLDYQQPTNYLVSGTNYNDAHKTPVLTAGKTFILGYTNELHGIFNEGLPVIIFDDFTTATQFVDFPFKAKSSAMKILQAKNKVNIKFMYEALQRVSYEVSAHERHWISKFAPMTILVPHPEEQQKIADCLTSLDDLIRLEAEKLDAIKAHKKGLMQHLFPAEGETLPKLRFPEFRDAGEWEVKKFGELCVFVRGPFGGALKKDIFVSNGFAVYEQSHAISGDFSAFRYFLTEKKYQELKRFSVQPGDIIMSCSGTMGKFSIIPKNYKAGIINQALLKLSVNKDYYLDFVKLALELPNNQEKLLSQSAGGAIKNVVGVKEIKEIELCLPSEKEQQKIADCLSALDTQITTQAEKIDALKAHKKGLMQQLFPQIGEVGA